MHEILASHGFGGDRLAILHGGMPQDEREKVKAAFQTSPKDSAVRIPSLDALREVRPSVAIRPPVV
jgi:hypothetical protein